MKKYGRCALTGHEGKFVKSHIIPQSVTGFEKKGIRVQQLSHYHRPGWRATSWYDDELVTQRGEDILKCIDDNGVKELRKHKMIWNGWNSKWDRLPDSYLGLPYESVINIRQVNDIDVHSLRMFYLSLAWRASASNRSEMADVKIDKELTDFMASIIKGEVEDKPYYFPVSFDQIISKGPLHNRTPFLDNNVIHGEGKEPLHREFIRFYFNGLVANVNLSVNPEVMSYYDKMALGYDKNLVFVCRKFDESRELREIMEILNNT